MRSADKVSDVDAVNGAYLCTRTAAGTKLVIDGCEIILYGNSTVGAGLLALHTADTAVRASCTGPCALIVVRAFYNDS